MTGSTPLSSRAVPASGSKQKPFRKAFRKKPATAAGAGGERGREGEGERGRVGEGEGEGEGGRVGEGEGVTELCSDCLTVASSSS